MLKPFKNVRTNITENIIKKIIIAAFLIKKRRKQGRRKIEKENEYNIPKSCSYSKTQFLNKIAEQIYNCKE